MYMVFCFKRYCLEKVQAYQMPLLFTPYEEILLCFERVIVKWFYQICLNSRTNNRTQIAYKKYALIREQIILLKLRTRSGERLFRCVYNELGVTQFL